MARRPATTTKTFGYYRLEILAALANGTFLLLVSAYIFYEAYHRLLHPEEIKGLFMLLVAAVGLLANGAGIVNETGNIGIGQGGLRIADKKGNQFRLLVQAGTGTIIRQMWDPKTSTWDEKSMKHWRY